jgi:hypothetical protein
LRLLSDEAFRVSNEGVIESVLARGVDFVGLTVMDLIGCHQADACMVMLLIVPIEETAAERFGILDAAEALWKLRLVLHGFAKNFSNLPHCGLSATIATVRRRIIDALVSRLPRCPCCRNALYVSFQDACLNMATNNTAPTGAGPRFGIRRPGIDENAYAGIMKINFSTGEMTRIHSQAWPGNGSALATGGDLLFWDDLNRRFHAFDSDSGKIRWEIPLGGMIVASTISYATDGKQYIAVFTGDGLSGTGNVLRCFQAEGGSRPQRPLCFRTSRQEITPRGGG